MKILVLSLLFAFTAPIHANHSDTRILYKACQSAAGYPKTTKRGVKAGYLCYKTVAYAIDAEFAKLCHSDAAEMNLGEGLSCYRVKFREWDGSVSDIKAVLAKACEVVDKNSPTSFLEAVSCFESAADTLDLAFAEECKSLGEKDHRGWWNIRAAHTCYKAEFSKLQ